MLLRAYAAALRQVPELLSRWEDDAPTAAGAPSVALAVATERGLLVPTFVEPDLGDAREKDAEVREVVRAAQSGKVDGAYMAVANGSLSNLGGAGHRPLPGTPDAPAGQRAVPRVDPAAARRRPRRAWGSPSPSRPASPSTTEWPTAPTGPTCSPASSSTSTQPGSGDRPRDARTLLEVARLYHLEGRSQAEVATLVGTGRSTVSRMLDEARRRGIVEIRLHDPSGRDAALEGALRERFGLTDVRVAARRDGPRLARVGALAATLLLERLGDARTVGVSWGRAVQATVDAVRTDHEHELTVLPLLGGTTTLGRDPGHDVSGQELVPAPRRPAGRVVPAAARARHARLVRGRARPARRARDRPDPRRPPATSTWRWSASGRRTRAPRPPSWPARRWRPDEARDFWAHEPVGDLAGRFFDGNGRPVTGPLDDRVMAVGLDDLTRVPLVIGVAAGRAKAGGRARRAGRRAPGRLGLRRLPGARARGRFLRERHELPLYLLT